LMLSGASNEMSSATPGATPGVVTCNLPEDAAECNITGTLYNSKHLNAFHRSAGARANEPEYDSIVCRGLRNRTASPITFTSMNPTERAPGIRMMLSINLGSLSNRTLLVNDIFDPLPGSGLSPRSARSRRMMGVRGCGLPMFRARSGSAATNPREWPRPRPGRDIEIRRAKNTQTRSPHCYGLAALSVGLNAVPDFHMA